MVGSVVDVTTVSAFRRVFKQNLPHSPPHINKRALSTWLEGHQASKPEIDIMSVNKWLHSNANSNNDGFVYSNFSLLRLFLIWKDLLQFGKIPLQFGKACSNYEGLLCLNKFHTNMEHQCREILFHLGKSLLQFGKILVENLLFVRKLVLCHHL